MDIDFFVVFNHLVGVEPGVVDGSLSKIEVSGVFVLEKELEVGSFSGSRSTKKEDGFAAQDKFGEARKKVLAIGRRVIEFHYLTIISQMPGCDVSEDVLKGLNQAFVFAYGHNGPYG